jgi:TRAP-type C4-dicarboxylate transport system permease small subunit
LLQKINKVLQKIEIFLSSIFVSVIFILTTVNIVMRYFFNRPFIWAEEITLFVFIWFGFITSAYTLSIDKHIRLELILDRINPKVRKAIEIALYLLIVLFFIYMMPSALSNIKFLSISPALQIPLIYIYIIVPISYVVMAFHTLVIVVEKTKQKETEVK